MQQNCMQVFSFKFKEVQIWYKLSANLPEITKIHFIIEMIYSNMIFSTVQLVG